MPTLAEAGIPKKQSTHAQALATVKGTKPELYEQVKAGNVSVAAAHVEVKRQEKREALKVRAEVAFVLRTARLRPRVDRSSNLVPGTDSGG